MRAGIPPEHVILDPGIGFGKLPEHNFAVLRARPPRRARFSDADRHLAQIDDRQADRARRRAREFGTAATVALAIAAGIDIVRVHDVPEQRDVVRVTDAIVRGWRPDGWTERLP